MAQAVGDDQARDRTDNRGADGPEQDEVKKPHPRLFEYFLKLLKLHLSLYAAITYAIYSRVTNQKENSRSIYSRWKYLYLK
jgi:hypothetical protein